MNAQITKTEREDLQRLIRQREKVLKSAARQRSAELMANFENEMLAVYRPEDDPVWRTLEQEARRDVREWNKRLAARNRELGIPDGFAPSLDVEWAHRGYNNALEKRRTLMEAWASHCSGQDNVVPLIRVDAARR